ncbi:sialic acid-binding Ig-like lectin 6 isoform X8 [Lutra lutra]|uniref:sialic acid-binding Ig-like lectin 6 isoform X8 n=1 Tax=Lutra lutra TaxID=9657 RepID=UPI001FD10703|nr:sialic acid-binding Ig-like lectin 6 isoform X8 [Lutra lutra]
MPLWLLLMLWRGEWADGRGGPTRGRHWSSGMSFSFSLSPGSVAQVLSYKLKLQKSMTVQEGLCVHVPCEFSYPWLPFISAYVSWFQKGADVNQDPPVATNKPNEKLHERTQGRFFIHGDPQTGNCSLDITEVRMGDSGTYFFHLGTYSYLDTMFSLNVTALTHTPHIIIPGTLESGHPRNLTCSVPWACERSTPPIFSWTSAALTSLGPRTHLSSVLTLTPRPQDHGTNLTCQVYFPAAGVMVERTVQLNVTYAPQNTAIRIFQGSRTALGTLQNTSSVFILEGQALQLLCVTDSNPPAMLSWFRGSPTWKATPICRSPILDLSQAGAVEEGDLICQAQNLLGSQHISLHLSVVYKPEPRTSGVIEAVAGAGTMALLSLCLCLIFRVKTGRKKTVQPVQSMDMSPAGSSGSGAYQQQSWTDIPAAPPAPAEARPISEEEQELHYALLRFPKPKYQEQEDIHTEYSEIKTHK